MPQCVGTHFGAQIEKRYLSNQITLRALWLANSLNVGEPHWTRTSNQLINSLISGLQPRELSAFFVLEYASLLRRNTLSTAHFAESAHILAHKTGGFPPHGGWIADLMEWIDRL